MQVVVKTLVLAELKISIGLRKIMVIHLEKYQSSNHKQMDDHLQSLLVNLNLDQFNISLYVKSVDFKYQLIGSSKFSLVQNVSIHFIKSACCYTLNPTDIQPNTQIVCFSNRNNVHVACVSFELV